MLSTLDTVIPEMTMRELEANIEEERQYLDALLGNIKATTTVGNNSMTESVVYDVVDSIEYMERQLRLKKAGVQPLKLRLKGNEVFAIDLDDTMGSFIGDFRRAYSIDTKQDAYSVLKDLPIVTDLAPHKTWNKYVSKESLFYDTIQYYGKQGYLYYNQPLLLNAGSIVKWLYQYTDGRVMFLTSRAKFNDRATRFWLEKIVGIDSPNVVYSENKARVYGFDVLIDDYTKNCQEVCIGGRKAIQMVYPYTNGSIGNVLPGYYSPAKNWLDVKQIIEG